MDDEVIGNFNNRTYKSVNFCPSNPNDTACDHCSFELGKCKSAIWYLGKCYVVENGVITKNIYYEEIEELAFA